MIPGFDFNDGEFLSRLKSGDLNQLEEMLIEQIAENPQALLEIGKENPEFFRTLTGQSIEQFEQMQEKQMAELDVFAKNDYQTNLEEKTKLEHKFTIKKHPALYVLDQIEKQANYKLQQDGKEPKEHTLFDLWEELDEIGQMSILGSSSEVKKGLSDYGQLNTILEKQKQIEDKPTLAKIGLIKPETLDDLIRDQQIEQEKQKINFEIKQAEQKILQDNLDDLQRGKIKQSDLIKLLSGLDKERKDKFKSLEQKVFDKVPYPHMNALENNLLLSQKNEQQLESITNGTYVIQKTLEEAYKNAIINTKAEASRLGLQELNNGNYIKNIQYKNLFLELFGKREFDKKVSENPMEIGSTIDDIFDEALNPQLVAIITQSVLGAPIDVPVDYMGKLNADSEFLNSTKFNLARKLIERDLISGTQYKLEDIAEFFDSPETRKAIEEAEEKSEVDRAIDIDFIYSALTQNIAGATKRKLELKNKLSKFALTGKSRTELEELYNKDPDKFEMMYQFELEQALEDLKSRDDKNGIWNRVIHDLETGQHFRKYHVKDNVKSGKRLEEKVEWNDTSFNLLQLSDIHLFEQVHWDISGEYADGSKKISTKSNYVREDTIDNIISEIIEPELKEGRTLDAIVFNGDFVEGKLLLRGDPNSVVDTTLDQTFAIMGANYQDRDSLEGDAFELWNLYQNYEQTNGLVNQFFREIYGFDRFDLKEHNRIMSNEKSSPAEAEYKQNFAKLMQLFEMNNPENPYGAIELKTKLQDESIDPKELFISFAKKIEDLNHIHARINEIESNYEGLKARGMNTLDLIAHRQKDQQIRVAKKIDKLAEAAYEKYGIETLVTLGNHDSIIIDQYLSHAINLDKVPAHILRKNGKSLKVIGGANFGIQCALPIEGNNHMGSPQADHDAREMLREKSPELFEALESDNELEVLQARALLHNNGISYDGFDPDRKRIEGVFSEHDKDGHLLYLTHNPLALGLTRKGQQYGSKNPANQSATNWLNSAAHESIANEATKNLNMTMSNGAGHVHIPFDRVDYFNGKEVDVAVTNANYAKVMHVDSQTGQMDSTTFIYEDGLSNVANAYDKNNLHPSFIMEGYKPMMKEYNAAKTQEDKFEIVKKHGFSDGPYWKYLGNYGEHGFNSMEEYRSHLRSECLSGDELKKALNPRPLETALQYQQMSEANQAEVKAYSDHQIDNLQKFVHHKANLENQSN